MEKAYDRVDREALWNVLKIYGVGGQLLKGTTGNREGKTKRGLWKKVRRIAYVTKNYIRKD